MNLNFIKNIAKNPISDIIGQDDIKKTLKSALIADRHIIIIGPPGIGKTTIAKNISKILPEIDVVKDCQYHCTAENPVCFVCKENSNKKTTIKSKGSERFIRIQGSPDLTVEDIIGDIDPIKAMTFGPLSIEAFTPGKIFKANNGILFFDEINRAPEKLQNALLQALQERKVTIGSYDLDIDVNFILIATMNPQDINTQKLSYVLLDRFDVVYMEYPKTLGEELEIVQMSSKKIIDFDKLSKAESEENLKTLIYYINFIRELRDNDNLLNKPSPRASIGLYERAQSNAILNEHKYPLFNDYQEALMSVLMHRMELKPSAKIKSNSDDFLDKEFSEYMNRNPTLKTKKDQGT